MVNLIAKDGVDVKDVGKPKRAVIRAAMDLQASATLEVDDLTGCVDVWRGETPLNSSSVGRNMSEQWDE